MPTDPLYGEIEILTPAEQQAKGVAAPGPLRRSAPVGLPATGLSRGSAPGPPPVGVPPAPGAPLTGPPSPFLKRFGETPARSKQYIEQVPKEVKKQLRDAGWSEDAAQRKTEEIEARLATAPASWWDLVEASLPAAVGAVVPAGRTASRIVSMLAANILGGAGIGALREKISGTSGPLAGGIAGALRAGPSAVAQTAVSAFIGPGRSTLEAQKAIRKLQESVSPAVGDLLDPRRPAAVLSRQTVKAMTTTANQSLDAMEARVATGLGRQMFNVPIPVGKGQTLNAPLPFAEIRTQIKALRDIGDAQYGTPEMRQTARKALQAAEALEETLLEQMRRKNFGAIADDYADTLAVYRRDRTAIRALKAIQARLALPGGANPIDNPELAEMVKHLKTPDLRETARTAIAAAFAAKGHLGIAGHYLGFGRGKYIKPERVAESVGPLRQPGSAILGAGAGVGIRYEQLPPLQAPESQGEPSESPTSSR